MRKNRTKLRIERQMTGNNFRHEKQTAEKTAEKEPEGKRGEKTSNKARLRQ